MKYVQTLDTNIKENIFKKELVLIDTTVSGGGSSGSAADISFNI